MHFLLVILVLLLTIAIVVKLYIVLTTGKCTSRAQMHGKTVLVTGANSGIGKVTAMDMAQRGARVILACRNMAAANAVRDEIIAKTKNPNVIVQKLHLDSLQSVRDFCKVIIDTEPRLDVLVNNAGMGGSGDTLTADGLNTIMHVNHFGPFLLTNLLLDLLKKSAPSRIVTVASKAHLFAYMDPNDMNHFYSVLTLDFVNYCNTKLCNILMSNELARRLKGTGVTSNALHPGAIRTNFFRNMRWWLKLGTQIVGFLFMIVLSPEEGAQTTIHLAVSDEVENVTGKYFQDCKPNWRRPLAKNEEFAKVIWEKSERFVNLK